MSLRLLKSICRLALVLTLCAQPVVGNAAETAAQQTISEVTRQFYQSLENRRTEGTVKAEDLCELVKTILLPHIDFAAMSQWVMGRYWRQATPAQQQRFVSAFRQLLVRTYIATVKLASLDQIFYLPERPSGRPDRAVVRTELRKPGEPAVSIDYYLHLSDGQWKVYDVRTDGISLISNYRSSFAAEIAGLGMEAFISRLEQKNTGDGQAAAGCQ